MYLTILEMICKIPIQQPSIYHHARAHSELA